MITAYAIFFGGVLLLGGRLSDLLGRRRLFMAGLTLFTVFSLLDGLSWSEGSLITFRTLQGLGAALLSPAALSILTTTFQEGSRAQSRARHLGRRVGQRWRGRRIARWRPDQCLQLVVDLLHQRARRRTGTGPQPVAASREPGRPAAPALRRRRRRVHHVRSESPRLRDDPRDPTRLGNRRHCLAARRVRVLNPGFLVIERARRLRCCRCGSSGCGR